MRNVHESRMIRGSKSFFVRLVGIIFASYFTSTRGAIRHMRTVGMASSFVDFDWESGHTYKFIKTGDLSIGAILPIHDYDEVEPCGKTLRESGAVQHVEAFHYAIEKINADDTILPGIDLGFVLLDDCATPVTALGQALHFMPINSSAEDEFAFYPVVGVIGSESSPASIMIANVLGMFEIPQISPTSTSDLLSDKTKFPYFMRMVPPDSYQVNSIIDVIQHFNWTYVSTVYSKGGYGESALEEFKRLAPKNGICIGATVGVKQSERNKKDIFVRAVRLLNDTNARVVIMFTDQDETRSVLSATKDAGLSGRFVWVGSDGMGVNIDDLDGLEDVVLGALLFKSYTVDVSDFRSYFERLNPKHVSNPWMMEMWADLFNCRWDRRDHSRNRLQLCDPNWNITDAADYFPEVANSIIIDAVYVFARALHDLIKNNCPQYFVTHKRYSLNWKFGLQRCTDGELLLQYLRNISFMGHNGHIEFDSKGDILGMYEILNLQYIDGKYITEQIAMWDVDDEQLFVNESKIRWGRDRSTVVPMSHCAKKCAKGYIYSYYKGTCCWECRKCRANERMILNSTKCEDCPLYQWPDQVTFDRCLDTPPTFLEWTHPAVIVFVLLSISGVIYSVFVFGVYLTHSEVRLIKATSRELAYTILVGVTLQYILLFIIIAKPSTVICCMMYIGFNVSFTIVYAALLTRTNRIYRIFHDGKRTKQVPTFTSPMSQVVIVLIFIGAQLAINVVVVVMQAPSAELRMPNAMVNYVELTCTVPIHGFIISLGFNVLLVLICSYYAFKTRRLPDNFNESRYISLCVYTTLLIWLAFLPSYFTASRAFYELILLSSALLLNASVTLVCLYTPRIYAIFSGATTVSLHFSSSMGHNNHHNHQPYPRTPLESTAEDQRTELDLTDFGNTNSNSDSSGTSS